MAPVLQNPNCPCTSKCPRHGKCVECIMVHQAGGILTACMGLVAAEKFDGMDAKEFEQMLHHYQKRADPAAEKSEKQLEQIKKRRKNPPLFVFYHR